MSKALKRRVPRRELEISFARSSGPGGQNVNKSNTKAVLRWRPADSSLSAALRSRFAELYASKLTAGGELVLQCDRFRSQERNVEECINRLEVMVARALKPPKLRKPTRVSSAARQRRLDQKRRRGAVKQQRKALPE